MSLDPATLLQDIFGDAARAHQRFADTRGLDTVNRAAAAIGLAVTTGRKVLAFGNGGSAADAQHLVAELLGRFEGERQGLAGVALTDSAVITAIANDYGYEHVFTRQIEALGRQGDVAFGISTSGQSPNVRAALTAAKARGMTTIALTGRDGGPIGVDADIHVNVAETSIPRVQEVHRTVLHAICSLVEQRLRS